MIVCVEYSKKTYFFIEFSNDFIHFSALSSAKPLDADEWVLVPSGNGSIIRVNLAVEMLRAEPAFSPEKDVTFELYTLKNMDKPQILSMDDITSITESNFNKNVATRIYIHGWQEYLGNMKKCFNDGKIFDKFSICYVFMICMSSHHRILI